MKWYMITETEDAALDPSEPKHPHLHLRGRYYWLICWDDTKNERTVESYGTNLGLMRLAMSELRFQAAVDNFNHLVTQLNEKTKDDHRPLRNHRPHYEVALQMIHDALDGMDAIHDQVRYRKSGEPTWEQEREMKREPTVTVMDQQGEESTTASCGSATGS